MRCAARRRSAVSTARLWPPQVVALDHVPELVAHVEAAVGQARDRAGQPARRRRDRASRPRRLRLVSSSAARHVDDAEQAAAFEVGAHDGADGGAAAGLVFVAEAAMATGNCVRADAGDLDAELSRRTAQCAESGAAPATHAAPRGWGRWIRGIEANSGVQGSGLERRIVGTRSPTAALGVARDNRARPELARAAASPHSHAHALLQRLARIAPYFAPAAWALRWPSSRWSLPLPPSRCCPALMKMLLDKGFGAAGGFALVDGAGGHHRLVCAARPAGLPGPVRTGLDRQPRRAVAARGDVRAPARWPHRRCSRSTARAG